ncbi:hypothetical protein [Paenibacillus sp. LjRoot153]|uniref:hypothetical protein n=1 Tax=Paenibacillus sp. LjRoot153 TaxID=3342270 RepID=UPI003F50C1D4
MKKVQLIPEQEGQLLTFIINVHNNGLKELGFNDYWVRLKNNLGQSFTVKLNPQDKDNVQIGPRSSQELDFYASLNDSTKLNELIFQFIKWDFNQSNFERNIGELSIPEDYTARIPEGESQDIRMNGINVKTQITKFLQNKNDKYFMPTVYLKLENVEARSVVVPNYAFVIRTSDGLIYPLEVRGPKDISINPKDSKVIQLFGFIPIAVADKNWQLIITDLLQDTKLNLPVASFQMPEVKNEESDANGHNYTFTNQDGTYTAQFNGIYRLPLGDQDMLSADLILHNKDEQSLSIPHLTGYFLLNGGNKIEAQMVNMAKSIGIGSGKNLGVQFVGEIPYTYEFSDLKLVIQQKESESKSTDILEFTNLKAEQSIPSIGQTEAYTISEPGRRTKYAVNSTAVYNSSSSDLFTAQVRVENLEKRFTNLPKLIAYFRSKDGAIFPATLDEVNSKISPSGKAQLNAWTKLPKGYPTQDLELILGEAIQSDADTTSIDPTEVLYVKPTAYWLPEDRKDVKSQLNDVTLYPYTISLSRIGTSISGNNQGISELTLKFNYELTKDLAAETNLESHKLVLAFEDHSGKTSFERSYEAKDFEPKAMDDDQAGQKRLLLGMHEGFRIDINEKDIIYQQQFLKKYTLNLYDEFHGHRKLLGSQKIDWFITTD